MLKVEKLLFTYQGQKKQTISNVSFSIEQGEYIAILGESGSGKSTLLRLLYGLENATSGTVFYNKEEIKGPSHNLVPGFEQMKFVSQQYDLLDYVTVKENVAKYLSSASPSVKEKQTLSAIRTVGLSSFKDIFPNQLSGGQRQRVAIARALAAKPKVLLLDEPYSNLDTPLKGKIRESITEWAKKNKATVITTTHDSADALGFSDRIFVMKKGRIIQKEKAELIKYKAKNEYIASLFGEYNIFTSQEMFQFFRKVVPAHKKTIIYPEQLAVNPYKGEGEEFLYESSRFNGRDYTLVLMYGRKKIIAFSSNPFKGELISLEIKPYSV